MRHSHDFNEINPLAEQRTRVVVLLTTVMMVVEITAGWMFKSMALLADGWHMSSHAIALGLSAAAYTLALRLARDERFAFGTWKIEILAGYTSAMFLVGVVVYMAWESITRLMHPAPIAFNEAIGIACLGLLVNLCSAWLLAGAAHHHPHAPGATHSHDTTRRHSHHHEHAGSHHHPHEAHAGHDHHEHAQRPHVHQDLNLRSAYVHVAADAATSVLAIGALVGGKFFGANWLDPVMGLIGSVIVAAWAFTLLRDTGRILLDAEMDSPVVEGIRRSVCECDVGATIEDLHVWRVGRGKYACVLSVETEHAVSADQIRSVLAVHEELAHVTVEVNRRG